MSIYILFRNDDLGALNAPERERRILELFERYHVPQVLAVIPNNVEDPHVWHRGNYHSLEESPRMIELLKEYHAKGLVELAQHGYTHQTTRLRPSVKDELTEEQFYSGIDRKWAAYQPAHQEGYSEFNGLDVEEQKAKIVKGKEYLENIFKLKLKTFIFPWNSYNRDALAILKERGIQFVPCEDDQMVFAGLYLIGSCNWDWEIKKFRKQLGEIGRAGKPVFTQFAYHSWEVSDEWLGELEDLLKELQTNPQVRCLLPHQIPNVVPWLRWLIPLRCLMVKLEKRTNKYLRGQIHSPQYYIRDPLYYVKRIVALSVSLFLLEYIGLKKLRAGLLLAMAAYLAFLLTRATPDWQTWTDVLLLVVLGGFSFGYRLLERRVDGNTA